MARKAHELGPLDVKRLNTPGLHFVGGVAGLALQIAPGGSRSWVLRATMGSRRREMGLGGFPDVTLAGARDSARIARALIRTGTDPIDKAKASRSELSASRAREVTFKHCAMTYLADHEASWSSKSYFQWLSSLENYVFPIVGDLVIRDVALPNVLAILTPIWKEKTETAQRIRGRVETILSWATVRGYRQGDNPARWRGHLSVMLPSPSKVKTVTHFAALPWREVPSFMARLREQHGQGARALEFSVLTAARSSQTRGMVWSEVDVERQQWSVPKERMKAGRDHRVPLSREAMGLLTGQPRIEGVDLVFPASTGREISDATMSAVLKRMGIAVVPHGFRSSFRDWCAEATQYPSELAEMALAHVVGNKVEAAYRRGDLLEKRQALMQDWADFCGGAPASMRA